MSRIDELIRELCPDGVESRPLRDLGTWQGGGTPSKHKPDYWRDGTTPWVTSGDMGDFELAATKYRITEAAVSGSAAKILPPNSVAVVMRSGILKHTLPVSLVPFRATVNQDLRAVTCHDDVMPRYALHVLRANAQRVLIACRKVGGTVESIDVKKLMAFMVPVPPLEVQREIVRVLDLFTTLEAELEAELEARRCQYAHYRDLLLTFPEGGVRWAPMGELGSIFGGLTGKSKTDFSDGSARFVSYVNVFNNIAVDVEARDYVRVGPDERQRALKRGDVLFTGSSETADEVGMSSVVTAQVEEPLYLNSFCIGYRLHEPDLLYPDFAKHLFRSAVMRKQIMKTASGVTRFNVSKARLAQVAIPIPAREEQARIVAILDKFDALVNDLSIGLPAELATRRKQYEYYRDRLLTFEEAVA